MRENKLNSLKVKTAKPGRQGDGGGLWLVVADDGAARWVFRFTNPTNGKVTEMGLGRLVTTSLAEARVARDAARKLVAGGVNPIQDKRASKVGAVTTFEMMVDQVIASRQGGWKSERHRAEWKSSLLRHAASLMQMPVNKIDKAAVLKVLQAKDKAGKEFWEAIPETASRVRNRIEIVLDFAKARDLRDGENPARWRGHLAHILRKHPAKQKHHASLPYAQVPDFLTRLRELPYGTARALEFTILTAARAGETHGAVWAEIDFEAKTWTVPAARMKASVEHVVPLSKAALAVLHAMRKGKSDDGFIFPGRLRGRPLAPSTMNHAFRLLKVDGVTVHGFRSSFRIWADEQTGVSHEIAETALAHAVGSAVSRAYNRGNALEKRRALMEDWGVYCAGRQVAEEQDNGPKTEATGPMEHRATA